MPTVSVIATKAFDLDGRSIHEGEAVDLEPVQAAIRARRGEVSLDRMARATYRTADMVAAPVVVTAVLPVSPQLSKRRRSSRRRGVASPATT